MADHATTKGYSIESAYWTVESFEVQLSEYTLVGLPFCSLPEDITKFHSSLNESRRGSYAGRGSYAEPA